VARNLVTLQVPFPIDVCCLASANFNLHGFITVHLNLDICASIVNIGSTLSTSNKSVVFVGTLSQANLENML
jgi:hypothetical protein